MSDFQPKIGHFCQQQEEEEEEEEQQEQEVLLALADTLMVFNFS